VFPFSIFQLGQPHFAFKVVLPHFAFKSVPGDSRYTPILIVPGIPTFNRRVANQSKAFGDEWNHGAISLEFSQPDLGAKQ
jgi:hypothetical protein